MVAAGLDLHLRGAEIISSPDLGERLIAEPLLGSAGDEALRGGDQIADGLPIDGEYGIAGVDGLALGIGHVGHHQVSFNPVPGQRRYPLGERLHAARIDADMAVPQRGAKLAKRVVEGRLVGADGRGRERVAKGLQPVRIDDVQIRTEVLRDIPGVRDQSQAHGAGAEAPGRGRQCGSRRAGPGQRTPIVHVEIHRHEAGDAAAEIGLERRYGIRETGRDRSIQNRRGDARCRIDAGLAWVTQIVPPRDRQARGAGRGQPRRNLRRLAGRIDQYRGRVGREERLQRAGEVGGGLSAFRLLHAVYGGGFPIYRGGLIAGVKELYVPKQARVSDHVLEGLPAQRGGLKTVGLRPGWRKAGCRHQ